MIAEARLAEPEEGESVQHESDHNEVGLEVPLVPWCLAKT